jgi:hypothetical protein
LLPVPTPAISSLAARAYPYALAVIAVAGLLLGWNRGQLPRRDVDPAAGAAANATAPDLDLYRQVVAQVRAGRGYYSVAREQIPAHGFPIGSPLNWRLPTYAWLFALLPGPIWIQALLVMLSAVALWLAFRAQMQASGLGYAVGTTLLLVGVVRWALDGDAYFAQEPWAATLIAISLSAHALGGRWRIAAVASGTGALLFRELALPYCGIACLCAAWNRRWSETAAWGAGITLFFGLFAWHVAQVHDQLADVHVAGGSAGLSQWLRFGGLDFVLLTTRLNGLLFNAPSALLWLYLLAALVGLARRTDETSRLACLAALAYLAAFAIVGRPENFYWGLIPAPLLAWGVAAAPAALAERWPSSVASGEAAPSPPAPG